MKITKKLATKLHEGTRRKNKKISVICVICGFIFFNLERINERKHT
jgi:hypothetical protein